MVCKQDLRDIKFYTILVGGGIFVFIIIILLALSLVDKRVHEIECNTGLRDCPTGMQFRFSEKPDWYVDANKHGWYEECIEQEVITHDRFLVKINDKGGAIGLEIEYNGKYWDRPTFNDTYKLIESRNTTTKCIKWRLVRK